MQANGNATQWPDGYPGRVDAEEDIARGHCFLVANDEGPLAVFELRPGTWTRLMVAVMRLAGGPDLGILPGSGP